MFLNATRSRRPGRRRDWQLLGATSAVIAADLVTKLTATTIAAPSTSGAIVPVHNPGLSLGLVRAPLGVAALLAVVGIVVAGRLTIGPARRGAMSPWIPAGLIGGAIANLVDRVVFGAVHDFLAAPLVVLNLADLAVVTALVAGTVHFRRIRRLG